MYRESHVEPCGKNFFRVRVGQFQSRIVGLALLLALFLATTLSAQTPFFVDDWADIGGRLASSGWTLDNDAATPAGDAYLSGPTPSADWTAIRGAFGSTYTATPSEALIVRGTLEVVGGDIDDWNPFRFGIFQHNGTGEADAYGYLITNLTGPNGPVSNGLDIASVWAVNGASWISTFGAETAGMGHVDEVPKQGIMAAGMYDFAVSAQPLADGTTEVRWYLVSDDGVSYWHAGTHIDTTPQKTQFNGFTFAMDPSVEGVTGLNLFGVEVDLGVPITIPPMPVVPPLYDCNTQSQIPIGECEALLTFFSSTNGPGWTNKDGWTVTNDPCSWFGVTCSGGHVSELLFSENGLAGGIPSELQQLTGLERLSLVLDNLSGLIPPELGQLSNLVFLDLTYNELNGVIPPELGQLTKLEALLISGNNLWGPIPSEIGQLTELVGLQLWENGTLSGPIPPELGQLTKLEILQLWGNQLDGPIPSELGNLSKLRVLDLSANDLSGGIPPQLGGLDSLFGLHLSYNNLSGPIPAELGMLTALRDFDLQNNNLDGPVPLEVAERTPVYHVCFLTGNDPSLCFPDTPPYQSIGDPICGLALDPACEPVFGLIYPWPGAKDLPTTVGLRWDDLGAGMRYKVQVAVDQDMMEPVFSENVPGDHAEFVAPIVGGTYFWRVKPVFDGRTYEWSEVRKFSVGSSGPLVAALQHPADGAGNQPKTLEFSWAAAPSAASYHLQVSEKMDFSTRVVDMSGIMATSYRAIGLPGGKKLYWRVAGVDANGRKTFSATRSFTTVVNAPGPIVLVAPDDGAKHVPPKPSFSWQANAAATTYQLQVSRDQSFSQIVLNDSANTKTSASATNALDYGTAHFWRVRGRNAGGNGQWSAVRSFETIVHSPDAVVLLEPSDQDSGVSTSPVFKWLPMETALTYQLQVGLDSTFADLVLNDSSLADASDSLETPLEYGTQYVWRVRGRNPGGNGAWSDTWHFTTIVSAPGAVTLMSPANGQAGVPTNPKFEWQAVDGALHYQLQVGTDSTFSTLVANDSALTDPSDSLETVLENGLQFAWRVRPCNEGGLGAWSETWYFTTIVSTPGMAVLLEPADGAMEVEPNVTFSWQAADNAEGYDLEISEDESFANPVVREMGITGTSTHLTDPLPYGTEYLWRVRGYRDDGLGKASELLYGEWSAVYSFTVAVGTATESSDGLPSEFALYPAYPNPFNPSTTISFDVPEPASVRLIIFDALGRVVKSLADGRWSAGRHKVTWDAGNVPSGIYFVRMEATGYQSTVRLVLTK